VARILVAGFCAVPSPDRFGVQLAHALTALSADHKVDVLAVRRPDQSYVEHFRRTRTLRVPVVAEQPLREQIETFRRALRRQIEGADYDVVHFRDGWAGLPAIEMRERYRLRTVFDVTRSPMTDRPLVDSALATELARDESTCIASADIVLAPSESAAHYLTTCGGGSRVRLAPVGVDVDAFDWDDPQPSALPRIVYAGRVRHRAGIRTLLRAMVEVARRTNALLSLVGPVERRFADILREDIRQLDLSERVEICGVIDHRRIPTTLAQATVCVAPEAVDNGRYPLALYPTKLLEYMACRRVVLAPRRGVCADIVAEEETGLAFAPREPTDLASQILRLLADAGLRERLAGAAYERVRERHTASAARRALRRVYAELVADILQSDDSAVQVAIASVAPAAGDETAEVTQSQIEESQSVSAVTGSSAGPAESEEFRGAPTVVTAPNPDDDTRIDVAQARDEAGDEVVVREAWLVDSGPLLLGTAAASSEDDPLSLRLDPATMRLGTADESPLDDEELGKPTDRITLPPSDAPVFQAAGTLLRGSRVANEQADPDTGESSKASEE
jgi:glycosyltransferase involved in cell wall biosynthesis